jgi:hypothetical protein
MPIEHAALHKFSKNLGAKFWAPKSDLKQVTYFEPTNVRSRIKKFAARATWLPGLVHDGDNMLLGAQLAYLKHWEKFIICSQSSSTGLRPEPDESSTRSYISYS